MAGVFPADISIDQDLAIKLIFDQFGITTKHIRLLGEGFDNKVWLINDHLVFRFPRQKVAIELLEHELNLLPHLKDRLPVKVPEPLYVGEPTQSYDAPFYGHEILAGRTGCTVSLSEDEFKTLARDLGQALKALHSLDFKALGLSPNELLPLYDRVDIKRMSAWLNERWASVKTNYNLEAFNQKFSQIVDQAQYYKAKENPLVLVHSDLYHRHLLFNHHNKLVAFIDWGDSCLSDRVVDMSVVFQFLPKSVHDIFFNSYGPLSPEEIHYGRFLGLYYAVTLLWFGHDRQDQSLIASSLKAINDI
jgi:aminoglycoside phosphotransferase (APT) family kinase protein